MKKEIPDSGQLEELTTQECNLWRTYKYKCKNHFNEMKGDVGMSLHEKEGKQKEPSLRQISNLYIFVPIIFCYKMQELKAIKKSGIGSSLHYLCKR